MQRNSVDLPDPDAPIRTVAVCSLTVRERSFKTSSLSNDFIWNDFAHLVKKYKPFVKIDKDHYIRQLEQEIGTVVK